MDISKEEKQVLIDIAKTAIKYNLGLSASDIVDTKDYPILKLNAGAFVTLTKNHLLRGCVGYIFSDDELHETIYNAAIQAAFHDPRFPALNKNEINDIMLEISILSIPFKMNNYDDIIVGKHGLIVTEHGHRGLLLPQVPIEHNMNKWEFLSALCSKAGLPHNLWETKLLNIEMFTATVFSEKDLEQ